MRAFLLLTALVALAAPLAAQPFPTDIAWTVTGGGGKLAFTPDGTGLLTNRTSTTIERLRTSDGTRAWGVTVAGTQDLALINGGTQIVSAHGGWSCPSGVCSPQSPGVRVWSADTGTLVRETALVSSRVAASAVGDRLVVTASPTPHSNRPGPWDPVAMDFSYDLFSAMPSLLAVSPDGSLVAYDERIGDDRFIHLVSVTTGATVQRLAHDYPCSTPRPTEDRCGGIPFSVAFSPDGALIAAGSTENYELALPV
ncbi:MAG TPA: WD40 repeat domain-containing protein, partial [Rhodothermales bacterium]|nr:WD40 repeat domain-containing protein [Rhodothermales bacterium]